MLSSPILSSPRKPLALAGAAAAASLALALLTINLPHII